MAQAEPIRDKKQLQKLAGYWLKRGNLRNYVLIVLGVCTALRISDLLCLKWEDVIHTRTGVFRKHITLTEKKTGKTKTIALNKQALRALNLYFIQIGHKEEYLFKSNRKDNKPISRIQAWRIIRAAAEGINSKVGYSCHSLRKSFGYHAWKSGTSPIMLMDIYNHTSFEITKRYLGISQDDRDKVYLSMTLQF